MNEFSVDFDMINGSDVTTMTHVLALESVTGLYCMCNFNLKG